HRRPLRRHQRHRGPDRALRRRPTADPAALPAAGHRRRRSAGRRLEGMVGMTTLATPVHVPVTISRRYLAAGTFIVLGLIDIFVSGFFAHRGDAVFALSLPGATPHVPSIRVPGAVAAYAAGAISIGLGILRAAVDLPRWGKRLSIAVVLLCFLVALL